MFGYIESPYTVENQADLVVRGGTQRFELRQSLQHWPGQPAPLPYIAVTGANAAGDPTLDTLFIYASRAALEADWARLTGPETVRDADLQYRERIEWHATGYGRDGGIAMY